MTAVEIQIEKLRSSKVYYTPQIEECLRNFLDLWSTVRSTWNPQVVNPSGMTTCEGELYMEWYPENPNDTFRRCYLTPDGEFNMKIWWSRQSHNQCEDPNTVIKCELPKDLKVCAEVLSHELAY